MKKLDGVRKPSEQIDLPSVAGIDRLIFDLCSLILSARHAAATTVNTLQVMTNFEIGRRIVEHEQKGEN